MGIWYQMPVVSAEQLRELSYSLLVSCGTPVDQARIVSDGLVNANLAGHDSHGVLRLPGYLAGVEQQHVSPGNLAQVDSISGATAVIDAHLGWGQPAMWLATETVHDLARAFGIAAAVVRNSYHIGRVAPYVEWLAERGVIAIAMANAAPAVAPFGGSGRVLGTNPIAWAVPRDEDKHPVSFDVATAGIAEGKLRIARAKGLQVPEGNLLDAKGRPTTNPHDFYAGGALLPFGAHKGSGFSLLAQFLGRGLAGLDPSAYDGPRGLNGPLIIAIDVSRFSSPETFRAEIEAQCDAVASSPPRAGVMAVQLPGEPELATREERLRDGVPVPETTWQELRDLAAMQGVAFPDLSRPDAS
ncbi:MAG: Ldh family oxidoreductase [Thermomicrobiales bacterium]|nr:Ldh family oxidoreductase [Thermomicrobiales bacterium]